MASRTSSSSSRPVRQPRRLRCQPSISEEIYFNALWASTELAEANGAHAAFPETQANGDLQDLWGVEPSDTERWEPPCATRPTVCATRS